MKIVKTTFFCFCLALVFASCKKDKEELGQKAIVGNWNIDKLVYSGETTKNAGKIKFTKKSFELDDNTYAVNPSEIREMEFELLGNPKENYGYEIIEGSTELTLIIYTKAGLPSSVFIELMTKDILIYTDGGIPSAKYYLSK